MTRKALAPVSCAVAAIALLVACSSPERELRKAKEAGTVEALDAFLAKYPGSPLAQEANDAKEKIFFDRAKATDTVVAYEEFLKRYPNGRLLGEARAGIERQHFIVAQRIGTIDAYEQFLRKFPQGVMAKDAGRALEGLLPSGAVVASAETTATDSATCTIFATVTMLHRAGAFDASAPPAVSSGMMNCAGTVGASAAELVGVAPRDPNHTLVKLKIASTAGWGGCRGSCTVRFSVSGQEYVVTALYQ